MILPVFLLHVGDHPVAFLVAEIDIEIGHRNAFGVQEAFEEQIEAERIDLGDPDAVGDETSRARSPTGSHRDPVRFGVDHEVADDQIVFVESHLVDHRKFVIDARKIFVPRVRGEGDLAAFGAGIESPERQIPKLFRVGDPVGFGKARKRVFAESEIEIATVGDQSGILERLRVIGEKPFHFLGGFVVKLVGLKADGSPLGNGAPGSDAEQDLLRFRVGAAQVMHVVGRHGRDARPFRDRADPAADHLIVLQAVILHFEVEVPFPEDGVQFACRLDRALHIPREDGARHRPRHTGGQGDQPLVVRAEQFEVDAGFGIEPLGETLGYHPDQVAVSRLVLDQQNEVIAGGVDAPLPAESAPLGDVDLAADDRFDPRVLAGAVKGDRAVEHAVVGQSDGGMPRRLRRLGNLADPAGAVEKTVFAVQVQMHESAHVAASFLFRAPAFFCRWRSAISQSRRRR